MLRCADILLREKTRRDMGESKRNVLPRIDSPVAITFVRNLERDRGGMCK